MPCAMGKRSKGESYNDMKGENRETQIHSKLTLSLIGLSQNW